MFDVDWKINNNRSINWHITCLGMCYIQIIILMISVLFASDDIIKKYCKEYNVEIALALAIAEVETPEDNIIRYEPKLKTKTWYLDLLTKKEKENELSFASLGELQILYAIAKSHGFKGDPKELLGEPGIKYGIIHLQHLIQKKYYLHKVIICYNRGHYKEKYKLYPYYKAVIEAYKIYGGKIK